MAGLTEPQRRQLLALLARVDAGLDGLDADEAVTGASARGTPQRRRTSSPDRR
jgi:hypothetical protein